MKNLKNLFIFLRAKIKNINMKNLIRITSFLEILNFALN